MRLFYIILSLVSVIYITTTILSFFGIGAEVYGIYLVILIAIILFYGVLSEKRGDLFTKSSI